MSELCCKFQVPASNTVGGVAETRTVLQSVMDRVGWTYVRTHVQAFKGKPICTSPLCGRGTKKEGGVIALVLFILSNDALYLYQVS